MYFLFEFTSLGNPRTKKVSAICIHTAHKRTYNCSITQPKKKPELSTELIIIMH